MKKSSKIAAVGGLVLIALAGLFPPVINQSRSTGTAERGFLLSRDIYAEQLVNRRTGMGDGVRRSALDLPRLVAEWVVLAAATAAVCLIFHRVETRQPAQP